MKKINLIIALLFVTLAIAQKRNGNLDVDGSVTINGNINVTGSITGDVTGVTLEGSIDSYFGTAINKFNPSLILPATSVNPNDGTTGSSGTFSASGRQKVEPNKRYYITYSEFPNSVAQPTGALRAFYDINGNYVNWSNLALEADNSWIVPANVHYAQWANTGTMPVTTQLIEASDLITPIVLPIAKAVQGGVIFDPLQVNLQDAYLRQIFLPLYSKKWVLMGDSITQQGKYIAFTQRSTGLIIDTNIGVGGALLGGMANNLTQQMVDDADVITVYGGTNDYGLSSSPIGTIADASNINSFYGQVRNCLETIHNLIDSSSLTIQEKAEKLVVFVTPVQRGTSQGYTPPEAGAGGKTLLQIRNAIIEVCAEFGTPVYDAYALSGLNNTNMQYLSDQLHPLDEGSVYGVGLGKFLNLNYKGF